MAATEGETNDPFKNEPTPLGDVTLRRNNKGCKSADFYNWPPQPLEEMDSPLAVQQYIQQLIHKDPSNIDEILKLPEGQDLGAWKIEHLRLFCMQLNRLAAKLQDCCLPETCKQMTATEQWIFLCAAHKQPSECPAIDYTMHTLDGAASLLNNGKYFPSRVTIKESSVAKLGSVCRRVYRIFSHAYYHHFQVFDEFERATHLCARFSKFVTTYDLMSKDSLIVPAEADAANNPESTTTVSATSNTETSNAQEGSQSSTENSTATTPDTQKSANSSQTDLNKTENATITTTGTATTNSTSKEATNAQETQTPQEITKVDPESTKLPSKVNS